MPKSTFSAPYKRMLETLISIRKAAGITQVELSERLRKQQAFVSNVERGVRRIDVIEFCVITKALGADPEAVFQTIARGLPSKMNI